MRLWAVACLAILCASVVGDARGSAFPGSNGKIAFWAGGIKSISPAGGNLAPVTRGSNADWFPTGNRLVFSRGGDLYTVRPDGGGIQQLTNTPERESEPTWSPDGALIVFSGVGGLWVMDSDGNNPIQLTTRDIDGSPSFSPDGRWIVFWRNGIALIRHDGSDFDRLTGCCQDIDPEWSPSGERILFTRCVRDGCLDAGDVWSMRRDGSDRRRLTTGAFTFTSAIAADGRRLAYEDDDGRGLHVLTLRTGAISLIADDARAIDPNWQPRCTIRGTDGNDELVGTPGRDLICPGGGNDVVHARGGNDVVFAAGGNDFVFGGAGKDVLVGGPGVDGLSGNDGNDLLNALGDAGDEIDGGSGNNLCRADVTDLAAGCS